MARQRVMNWDYIAGYFDGEGHVEKSAYGIGFANSHLISIEQIRDFIEAGTIETRPGTNKPVYQLRVRNLTALRRLVPELLRRCIVKRDDLTDLSHRMTGKAAQPRYGIVSRVGSDQIRRMYWDLELSCEEIATHIGARGISVAMFMRRHDIPRRTLAEAMDLAGRKGRRRGRFSQPI